MLGNFITWRPGDPILASKLQRMAKEATAARQWRVSGNVKFKQTPSGQALYIPMPTWTGIVWFGNDIIKDYTTTTEAFGGPSDPNWVTNNVEGVYLVVNLTTGACRWADELDELDNTNEQAFWVANSNGSGRYTLNSHTQGDIHARIT